MNRGINREIFTWAFAFVLAIIFMMWRPLSTLLSLPNTDFFFALQFFACYFYGGNKAIIVCLLAGVLKDILFGLAIGPGALLGVIIPLTFILIENFYSEPLISRGYLLLMPLVFYNRFIQALLFTLFHSFGESKVPRDYYFSKLFLESLVSLPGIILAFTLFILLFRWLMPKQERVFAGDDLYV